VTLENELNNEEVTIFPNPASEHIFISTIPKQLIGSNISIKDLNGKLLLQKLIDTNNQVIDIVNFEDGVYILEIGKYSYRIVIQ
jgi:hypothetical protein